MSEDLQDISRELERRSTEELLSILRNRDEEEWRAGVFEIVASILRIRGLSSTEIDALGPEGAHIVEPLQLVTVARYSTPLEAHVRRMALEGAGLPAWVTDEAVGTMYGMGIGSRLQVRAEDEAAARTLLEDL